MSYSLCTHVIHIGCAHTHIVHLACTHTRVQTLDNGLVTGMTFSKAAQNSSGLLSLSTWQTVFGHADDILQVPFPTTRPFHLLAHSPFPTHSLARSLALSHTFTHSLKHSLARSFSR